MLTATLERALEGPVTGPVTVWSRDGSTGGAAGCGNETREVKPELSWTRLPIRLPTPGVIAVSGNDINLKAGIPTFSQRVLGFSGDTGHWSSGFSSMSPSRTAMVTVVYPR